MEQAMEALLERNRLQFENDTRNAGHNLWPAQRWLGEAIAPLTKQQGLVRLAVECDARVSELRNRLDERHSGLQLNRHGDELQLSVRGEFSGFVEMYLQPVTQKSLSQSVMETLSIIAYRQPITKAEVEAVRGVKCDYSIQSLTDKGFIEEAGRKETLGRPILYRTTDEFLRHFGIESLDQLPAMEQPPEGELGV